MISPHGPIEAGEIADGTITDTKIYPYSMLVFGLDPAYRVARGTTSVTGAEDIHTGLTTVMSVVASLGEDPDANAATVTAAIAGAPGHAHLKVWKLAEAAPNTLVASDVAKTVNWVAVGT